MLQIADPFRGRKPNGSYSNQHDAYTANTCLDFAAPTDVATYTAWAERLEESAPHFAQPDRLQRPAPAPSGRSPPSGRPRAVTATGAPPIVVVGTTGDPATPYAWAEALAEELESGRARHPRGRGPHGVPHELVRQQAVDAYLLELTVPKAGLTCQ